MKYLYYTGALTLPNQEKMIGSDAVCASIDQADLPTAENVAGEHNEEEASGANALPTIERK